MARVQRPVTRGEYDYNELPMFGSLVDTSYHPWDFTDEEIDQHIEDLNRVLAKKRPLGFAPWPLEG